MRRQVMRRAISVSVRFSPLFWSWVWSFVAWYARAASASESEGYLPVFVVRSSQVCCPHTVLIACMVSGCGWLCGLVMCVLAQLVVAVVVAGRGTLISTIRSCISVKVQRGPSVFVTSTFVPDFWCMEWGYRMSRSGFQTGSMVMPATLA